MAVSDDRFTGFIWAENIGWINVSPQFGGVGNDGTGVLSGYDWGENVGWINFSPPSGSVTIDADGSIKPKATDSTASIGSPRSTIPFFNTCLSNLSAIAGSPNLHEKRTDSTTKLGYLQVQD